MRVVCLDNLGRMKKCLDSLKCCETSRNCCCQPEPTSRTLVVRVLQRVRLRHWSWRYERWLVQRKVLIDYSHPVRV